MENILLCFTQRSPLLLESNSSQKWHFDMLSCWAADVNGNTVGGEQDSVFLIVNNRDMSVFLVDSTLSSTPAYIHASYLIFTATSSS